MLSAGVWNIQALPEEFGNATISSLVVDSMDRLHASVYVWEGDRNNSLAHAEYSSGNWSVKVIADIGNTWGYWYLGGASIAVDSRGSVHMSYYSFLPINSSVEKRVHLCYATNKSGLWEAYTIDSMSPPFELSPASTSIAVDSVGLVHISYFKESKTARGTGSQFIVYATDSIRPGLSGNDYALASSTATCVALGGLAAWGLSEYYVLRKSGRSLSPGFYAVLQIAYWFVCFPALIGLVGITFLRGDLVQEALSVLLLSVSVEFVAYHGLFVARKPEHGEESQLGL
jgi:hypothetical protein